MKPFSFFILLIAISFSSFSQCKGDFNGDGRISAIDLSQFLSSYGTGCEVDFPGDFDIDGAITTSDLSHFISVFGTYCEEPLSLEPLIWWYYQDAPNSGIVLDDLHSVQGDFTAFDSLIQNQTDSIFFQYLYNDEVFFSGYDESAITLNVGQIAEAVQCNEFINITIRLLHSGYVYEREITFYLVMHFAFDSGDACENDGVFFTFNLFGPKEHLEFCLNCTE